VPLLCDSTSAKSVCWCLPAKQHLQCSSVCAWSCMAGAHRKSTARPPARRRHPPLPSWQCARARFAGGFKWYACLTVLLNRESTNNVLWKDDGSGKSM
jgi:hypothetical protein